MKKYYSVVYRIKDCLYSARIVKAKCFDKVKEYFSRYDWFEITEVSQSDFLESRKKCVPVLDIF